MIELIGLIVGGVGRLLPEVFAFFKAKQEGDHEYRMTELQLKVDAARASQAIDLAHAQAEIAQQAGEMSAWAEAIRAQATPSGVRWVDGLSASVRPFLTYWHCVVLYTAYKVVVFYMALNSGAEWTTAAIGSYGDFDRAVVGSIIAYWFIDRSLRKIEVK